MVVTGSATAKRKKTCSKSEKQKGGFLGFEPSPLWCNNLPLPLCYCHIIDRTEGNRRFKAACWSYHYQFDGKILQKGWCAAWDSNPAPDGKPTETTPLRHDTITDKGEV